MSSFKRYFQNTINEMVKMTYAPNTIEIPTHEADLKHHRVGFERRSKNRQ
jgi:hypothetical protein